MQMQQQFEQAQLMQQQQQMIGPDGQIIQHQEQYYVSGDTEYFL